LRASVCALCAVVLLAFAGAGAPAALATSSLGTGGALSELTGGNSATETTETSTSASTSASTTEPHNSDTLLLLGGGAAIALLFGIAFLIMRDVRGVVPATDGDLLEGSTARHSEAALRKRRAKAKAARRQRKRNR
jgi:hypothetical protein